MADEHYKKELNKAKFYSKEIEETLETGEKEDILTYDRICDTNFEEVRNWSENQKDEIKFIRGLRSKLKEKLDEYSKHESRQKHERELHQLRKKHELELELANTSQQALPSKTQAVKLQKYTITPFKGDFKDWLRFWNQFTVEVDGSGISDISKFNYLLELVQGKPRDDILGLPHTVEGYEEAKKILVSTYGKDVKVHKALIKELESLSVISSTQKVNEIHNFYDKFSGVVRALSTMKNYKVPKAMFIV